MRSARLVGSLLAIGTLAACMSSSADPGPAAGGPSPTASPSGSTSATPHRPLLIKHGWDLPEAEYVRANARSMDQQPFDGVTMRMPDLSDQVFRQAPVSTARFARALEPMRRADLDRLEHNFVIVYSTPAGDLYDDWSAPVANAGNLARAARAAGLEGVFFDNEDYFGPSVDYPANCADRTVSDCQAMARTRGEQVMDAMRAAWPDIRVIVTRGAWMSDATTGKNLTGVPYNDIAHANPLTGSFVVGMVDSAAGTKATLVDGGEIYTARTLEQFQTVKAWQKDGMANSGLVPRSLRAAWPGAVSAGFGVYDQPSIDVGMDARTWTSTLRNALATTDKYVWAYTERHNWWGGEHPAVPVPATWVDATRAARTTAPK